MSQGNRLCARSIASHDEAALARHQRQALGPTRRDIDHRQRLDERASHRCAAMGHHVDLAEARRRIVPVIERPDRHFAPDRRIKADPTALAAGRRDFGLDQQAIDRRCADAEHQRSIGLAELQPAMPLQRRQQRRDHHLEPLAADPIRGLPQRHQRILDRRAVGRPALPPGLRRNCDRGASARTACLRCQPVTAHSSSRMRPFSARPADR